MGDQVFASMAEQLGPVDQAAQSVRQDHYQRWKKEFTFAALKYSERYGQSFCKTFGITDYQLYYERDFDIADAQIRKHYLV